MVVTAAYEVSAEVWRSDGPGDRYFVTLPDEVSERVLAAHGSQHHAAGSVPVSVALGRSIWSTSLYSDLNTGSYVIPIKDDVRRRERVRDRQVVSLRFAVKR
jgi:hypothetical protein